MKENNVKLENNATIKPMIEVLEKLFTVLNKKFYQSELEQPVITIQKDSTKGAYGWCTSWRTWKESKDDIKENEKGFYEINICADYLYKDFVEVAETLLHEMAHLYNAMNKVKDTSRNGYFHNKKYKETAEAHGLIVSENSKYGWSDTKLNETALKAVENFKQNENFKIFRYEPKKARTAKKSNSIKYICPCCNAIVRATKEVSIKCADCDEYFIIDC